MSIQRMMAWSLVPILRLRSIVLAESTLMEWCVPVVVGEEEEEGRGCHRCISFPVRYEGIQQITQRACCCSLLWDRGKPVAVIRVLVLRALRSEMRVAVADPAPHHISVRA